MRSPKALRAGMGAQFSLPVVTEVEAADLQGRFTALSAKGISGSDYYWKSQLACSFNSFIHPLHGYTSGSSYINLIELFYK